MRDTETNGILIQPWKPAGAGQWYAEDFCCNDAGELIQETDIYGNITHYKYNMLGHVTSVTDGVGRVTKYYYLFGERLEKAVYPDSRQTAYEYDRMGRVSRETRRARMQPCPIFMMLWGGCNMS